MSIEHLEGPTPAPSYRGFAGQRLEPPPARPARDLRPMMAAGLAVAAVLGIGLGIWAGPRETGAPDARPMQPAASSAGPQVQIALNPEPPPVEPPPSAPMEVLPPDMAAAAPRAMTVSAPRPAPAAEAPSPAPEAPPPSTRVEPPSAVTAFPNPPAFDCGGALSAAQAMVCADARLSAKDRRLARAYREALRAGVPAESLALEQDDWRAIREDAAQVSPRAVAQVYDQRIRELEEISAWGRYDE